MPQSLVSANMPEEQRQALLDKLKMLGRKFLYESPSPMLGMMSPRRALGIGQLATRGLPALAAQAIRPQWARESLGSAFADMLRGPENPLAAPVLPEIRTAIPERFMTAETAPWVGHAMGTVGLAADLALDPTFWAFGGLSRVAPVGKAALKSVPKAAAIATKAVGIEGPLSKRVGGALSQWVTRNIGSIETLQVGRGADETVEFLTGQLVQVAEGSGAGPLAQSLAETFVRNLQQVWQPTMHVVGQPLTKLGIGISRGAGQAETATMRLARDMQLMEGLIKADPSYLRVLNQGAEPFTHPGMAAADPHAAAETALQEVYTQIAADFRTQRGGKAARAWGHVKGFFSAKGTMDEVYVGPSRKIVDTYRSTAADLRRESGQIFSAIEGSATAKDDLMLVTETGMRRFYMTKGDPALQKMDAMDIVEAMLTGKELDLPKQRGMNAADRMGELLKATGETVENCPRAQRVWDAEQKSMELFKRYRDDIVRWQTEMSEMSGIDMDEAASVMGDLGEGYWPAKALQLREGFAQGTADLPLGQQNALFEASKARPIDHVLDATETEPARALMDKSAKNLMGYYQKQYNATKLLRDMTEFAHNYGARAQHSPTSAALGWFPLGKYGGKAKPWLTEEATDVAISAAIGAPAEDVVSGSISTLGDFLFPRGVHQFFAKNIGGDMLMQGNVGAFRRTLRKGLSFPRMGALWSPSWLAANLVDNVPNTPLLAGLGTHRTIPARFTAGVRLTTAALLKDVAEMIELSPKMPLRDFMKASATKVDGAVEKFLTGYLPDNPGLAKQLAKETRDNPLLHGSGTAGWMRKGGEFQDFTSKTWSALSEMMASVVKVGGATEDLSRKMYFITQRLDGVAEGAAIEKVGKAFVDYSPAAQSVWDNVMRDMMYFWTYMRQRTGQLAKAGVPIVGERPLITGLPFMLRDRLIESEFQDPEYKMYFKGMPDYMKQQWDYIPRKWDSFPFNLMNDTPEWVRSGYIPVVRARHTSLEMAGDWAQWVGWSKLIKTGRTDLVEQTMRRMNPLITSFREWESGDYKGAISSATGIYGKIFNAWHYRKSADEIDEKEVNRLRRRDGIPKISEKNPYDPDTDVHRWQMQQVKETAREMGVLIDFQYIPKMVANLSMKDWMELNEYRASQGRSFIPPSAKQKREYKKLTGEPYPTTKQPAKLQLGPPRPPTKPR